MAIETNENTDQTAFNPNKADQPHNDAPAAAAAAASFQGPAPTGSDAFLTLRNRIGLDRTDGSVEPYLTEVLKHINTALPDVKYERLQKLSNSYVFRYDGPDGYISFFGIQFASTSDPVSQQFVPTSMKMRVMIDELRQRYADNQRFRLVDARVILVGYEPEMTRTFEMADTIVRTFNVTTNVDAKNAKIDALIGTEFAATWGLNEARKLERQLSPHGVPPRMEVALTMNAKIQNNFGRDLKEYEVDYQPFGVIGGYVEIRAREPFTVNGVTQLRYRPVFNITVCNSVIPLEGAAAILLAALAPTIYTTKFWATQWQNLSEGQPQPGLLEEDPQNPGRPYVIRSREDLNDFIDAYFAQPEIAFQFQDGKDSIPGMWRLATSDVTEKRHFGDRLSNFFGVQAEDLGGTIISHVFETRADGVYGEVNGTLHDSRDIDYLYIAAKNGFGSIDQDTKRVLLGGSDNPRDRAQITANVTGSFTPLYLDSLAAVNADFIKWIIRLTETRRLTIVDPNSQVESRTFGSFLQGFGSGVGIGSIVSSGITNRGLGLGSIWNT